MKKQTEAARSCIDLPFESESCADKTTQVKLQTSFKAYTVHLQVVTIIEDQIFMSRLYYTCSSWLHVSRSQNTTPSFGRVWSFWLSRNADFIKYLIWRKTTIVHNGFSPPESACSVHGGKYIWYRLEWLCMWCQNAEILISVFTAMQF